MKHLIEFHCPLCNTAPYEKLKEFENKVVVGKCNACGLIYTPLRDENPEDLFGELNPMVLEYLYAPIISGKVKHFRHRNFEKYLQIIAKYSSKRNLLDVGCAHGFFPYVAKTKGYEVSGIEPNKTMSNFANNILKIPVFHGTLDEVVLKENQWDVITFTDSLEYFVHPVEELKKLVNKHLLTDGVLFIKVPNGNYFLLRHYFSKTLGMTLGASEAFTPSKRVVHYSYKTIQQLAKELGLKILKVGHITPIDSPVWEKYTGLPLEYQNPLCLSWRQKSLRRLLHIVGKLEFCFSRRNHFSQSIYLVCKKA